MGVKIRTMWMTPFYLFMGVLFVYIFQAQINLKKLKGFVSVFLILFIFSPFAYAYISITQTDKRTDYGGKAIAVEVEQVWKLVWPGEDEAPKIVIVMGNEWDAGNLSYHLKSRPKWIATSYNEINGYEKHINKLKNLKGAVVYIGPLSIRCEMKNIFVNLISEIEQNKRFCIFLKR